MLVPTVACFACAWLGGPRRAPAIWLGARDALADGRQRARLDLAAVPGATRPSPRPRTSPTSASTSASPRRSSASCRATSGAFPRALWLDGALGAAGAATALAAALSPVLSATQGDLATVLVGAAYTARTCCWSR